MKQTHFETPLYNKTGSRIEIPNINRYKKPLVRNHRNRTFILILCINKNKMFYQNKFTYSFVQFFIFVIFCNNLHLCLARELPAGCKNVHCGHGGTCVNKDGGLDFECLCEAGYEGSNCQARNPCYFDDDCDNGRICKRIDNFNYTCVAIDFCETIYSDSCKNGGRCINATSDAFHCKCENNFSGQLCDQANFTVQHETNLCQTVYANKCKNGGRCVNATSQSFDCDCIRKNFTGKFCQYFLKIQLYSNDTLVFGEQTEILSEDQNFMDMDPNKVEMNFDEGELETSVVDTESRSMKYGRSLTNVVASGLMQTNWNCIPALWIHNLGHLERGFPNGTRCRNCTIIFGSSTSLNYYKRDNITVWATLHWNCQQTKNFTVVRDVKFFWELYRLLDNKKLRFVSLVDKLLPDQPDHLIQFRPWILPYGNYLLYCRAAVTYAENEVIDKLIQLDDEGVFSIIISKPTAVINGPEHEVRLSSETIVLSGNLSFDPDIPSDGRPQTKFKYRWDCEPIISCPTMLDADQILTIESGHLKANMNYTFSLTIIVPRGNEIERFDKTEKLLTIISGPDHPHIYSLRCLRNCNKKVIANRKLVLKCQCETCTNMENSTLEILGSITKFLSNQSFVSIYDKRSDRISAYIQIESEVLQELQKRTLIDSNAFWTVGCKAEGDVGWTEKKIKVYLPPTSKSESNSNSNESLSCIISPDTGYALETPFSIKCPILEEDPREEHFPPLEYSFYMRIVGPILNYPSLNRHGYLFYHDVTTNVTVDSDKQHIFQFVMPGFNVTFRPLMFVEISNSLGNMRSLNVAPRPRIMPVRYQFVDLVQMYSGRTLRSSFIASLAAGRDYHSALQFIIATVQQLALEGSLHTTSRNFTDEQVIAIRREILVTLDEHKSIFVLSTLREIEHAGNVMYALVWYTRNTDISPICDNVCISRAASLNEHLGKALQLYLRPLEIIKRKEVRLFRTSISDGHVFNIGRAGVRNARELLRLLITQLRILQKKVIEKPFSEEASFVQVEGQDIGLNASIDRDYFLTDTIGNGDVRIVLESDNTDTLQLQIQDLNKIAERLLLTLKLFGDAVVSQMSVVDRPFQVPNVTNPTFDFLSLSVELFPAHSINGQQFPHNVFQNNSLLADNHFTFSEDADVTVEGENQFVQVLVIVWSFNPFLETSADLETPLLLVEIKDDQTFLVITPEAKKPHQFMYTFLENKTITDHLLKPFENGTNLIAPFKVNAKPPETLESKDIVMHHLPLPQNSRVFIIINDTRGLNLGVIAKKDSRPICQDFQNITVQLTPVFNITENNQIIYSLDTEETISFSETGLLDYYFSFWPDQTSLTSANLPTNADNTININAVFSRFRCVSRQNILKSVWEENCLVNRTSGDKDRTFVCLCNHFSIFGVTIIRSNDSTLKFTELDIFPELDQNNLISYVVGACLLAYLVLFIILGNWDRHNHLVRPKLLVMADIKRIREDTFYLLLVETGNNFSAGSTANVCCQLYGEKGRSKEYVLSDENLDTTRQNGYDTYLVSSVKNLGQLEKIRIWHDNSGHTASWYCRQIIVRNIKTDEFWIFFIHRWLTVYMDKESLICRQPVASAKEVKHYLANRISLRRYWHQIREQHLWLSPITCPPRSTHLRIERLTIAAGLLFIYMLLLIFLYGTPAEGSTALMAEFGVYDWSHHVFWYGFGTGFVGIFIGLVLVFLFRRIRKERIPALLVWDKRQLEEINIEEKQLKPKKYIDELFKNEKDLDETDSENEAEKHRWDNLDPDRVMVEGIPQIKVENANSITSIESIESSEHVFSIPSTNILQTERWISQALDTSHGPIRADDLVRRVPDTNKTKTPDWKLVMDHGLIAQIAKMRSEDPSSFIYESQNHIEHLIEDSVHADYPENGNDYSNPKTRIRQSSSLGIETEDADQSLGHGYGDSKLSKKHKEIEKNYTVVRHAKIQTDRQDLHTSGPLPRYIPLNHHESPEESEKSSDISLDRKKSSTTIKPFINPQDLSVELGEIECDYEGVRMIPRKYLFIPWLVCILVILISSFVTIAYGLRYSYVRSLEWCTSLGIATFVSFFIVQPLKVLIMFLITIRTARKNGWKSREEFRIFNKFELIWTKGSSSIVRLWKLNYLLYMPTVFQPALSGAEIFTSKLKVRRKSRVRQSLIDFIVGCIFLILVVWAGHLSRDKRFYLNHRSLVDILMLNNETHLPLNKNNFANIRTDEDFYRYMTNVFIPAVHLSVDTRGRELTVLRSNAAIRTKNNEVVLLGVPHIRQLRVKPEAHDCKLNNLYRPFCNEEFSDTWYYSNKDTQNYSEGWQPDITPRIISQGNDLWSFRTAEETESTSTQGELNTYEGGGYIAELGRIQTTSLGVVRELQRSEWLDARTRAFFVEFSAYNPNLNIHTVVVLIFEKAASLHYVTSSQVLSWRFAIPGVEDGDVGISLSALILVVIIFCLCLVYFLTSTVLSSIRAFRVNGPSAFMKFLLWLDVLIFVMGITVVWRYFIISNLLDKKLTGLRDAPANAYFSFQIEEERHESQILLFAGLTALGICKIWYLLLVSSRLFYIIGFTFAVTGRFMLGCILIFVILLVGFCFGARIVFGDIRLYRTFGYAWLTQTYHAGLRNVMPYEVLLHYPVYGRLFYFGFSIFVVILFVNVIASVVTLGLQEAKETSLQRPFRTTFHNYIWMKLQMFIPEDIRKRYFNNPAIGLSEEREEELERCIIPILWNHLNSIPVQRVKEMKEIAEEMVEGTEQKIVSKREKENTKKGKILKIEESRVNQMRELTILHIKNKLKIDFEAPELKEYNKFTFTVLQLKLRKVGLKLDELSETVDHFDISNVRDRQFSNFNNAPSPLENQKKSSDPWESESDLVINLK